MRRGPHRSSLRRAALVLLTIALAVLVLKGIVGALEAKLVFFPYRGEDQNPAALGVPYEPITIETTDGERLAAWQLAPFDSAQGKPVDPIADVVYFHGNGGNLSVWLPVFATLHQLRLRVLAVDYRGYGLSTGTPTEQGVYRDAEATVRHAAASRGAAPSIPLIYWGRSLGGPVAAAAARVVAPDGLILESTFAEKAAVIRSQPVLRGLNVFGTYKFDTVRMLEGVNTPVLVMHGDRDTIVPLALGRELYEQLRAPKRFVALAGLDHNDFVDKSRSAYWQPVLEFIASLRPGAGL